MNKRITKFLEFKGKNLLFLSKDGIYWIAIKPVCEALGVQYKFQHERIMRDPILGPVSRLNGMQVPGDQVRNMTCLPEEYVYGWIFSIQSDSPELLQYKQECYHALFNHFHGAITSRRDLLREKITLQQERLSLENSLRQNEKFVRYENLRAQEARIGIALKRIDKQDMEEAADLFTNSEIEIS